MKRLSRQLICVASVALFLLVALRRGTAPAPPTGAQSGVPAEAPAPGLVAVPAPMAAPAIPRGVPGIAAGVVPAPDTFSAFDSWAAAYLAASTAGTKEALLGEGIAAVTARRQELAGLIKSDPERALRLAVSFETRQQLPAAITGLLEEPVSGRGDFALISYTALPGHEREVPADFREVVLNHRTYQAFVYGRRVHQHSHPGLSLHGVAIDQDLALSSDSVRILDAAEAAQLPASRQPKAGAVCALCGQRTTPGGATTLAEFGGRMLTFCHAFHAIALNESLAEAESNLSPPVGNQPRVVKSASALSAAAASPGGSAGATPKGSLGVYPVTNLPPAGASSSQGEKTLLLIPVLYADDPTPPSSIDSITASAEANNRYFTEASYGTASFDTTVTPYVRLPETKRFYGEFLGFLRQDAIAGAAAMAYDVSYYQYIYTIFNPIAGISFGGRSDGLLVGGAGAVTHELGHNFGLSHANFWDTRGNAPGPVQPNPPFPVDLDSLVGHDDVNAPERDKRSEPPDIEYGDPFDVMGSGGGHFSTVSKWSINWLPDQYTHVVSRSETNRIYAFDTPGITAGRLYALRIPKDRKRVFWASYRQGITDNPWLLSGIELTWGPWTGTDGSVQLVDTTPGTSPGRLDGAVVIGRTYHDPQTEMYLTPIAKGGVIPSEKWMDVVVQFGPFPTNLPPTLALSASQLAVNPGDTVTFTAVSTDPNGDALAYNWDFSDTTFGTNSPTNLKTFFNEGQYSVRCEVSDMKGGLTSAHVVVVVGNPTNLFTMSGRVIDSFGNPVQGARVHNSGSIPPYVAAPEGSPRPPTSSTNGTYRYSFTDSQGYYTIGNIPRGVYTNRGFVFGYKTQPLFLSDPTVLNGANAINLDHLATPLPLVSLSVLTNAYEGASPGIGGFKLTRSLDTNNDISVRLFMSGTALQGTNYVQLINISSNIVVTTNGGIFATNLVAVTNPMDHVVIPAGWTSTNISIIPINDTNGTGPKSVTMTLLLATNDFRITSYLTNVVSTVTNAPSTNGVTVTNTVIVYLTNQVLIPGWELLPTRPADDLAWYQTYSTYALAVAERTLTLFDDDPPDKPTVSVVTLDTDAIETVNDSATIAFVRTGGSVESNLVVYYTLSGTASNGVDYQKLSGSVTIPAGQQTVNLAIVGIHDLFVEGNQTVGLTVSSNGLYNIGGGSAQVLLVNDNLPLMSIYSTGSTTVKGGSSGSVTIEREGDLSGNLVVNYLVTGTAISGVDYQVLPGSVTIPAGQINVTIPITPINSVNPGPMSVIVLLSAGNTYNISSLNGKATVTIIDNLPLVTITGEPSVAEANPTPGLFTISRTGPTNADLLVNFEVGGTAIEGGDYAAIGRSVTIPAGSASATVPVQPHDDRFNEFGDLDQNETVIIQIDAGSGYTVGSPSAATMTIVNDDAADLPAIGFLLSQSSGREDSGAAIIAVKISANPKTNQQPALMDYRVTGGSALPGVNYGFTGTGTVSFVHFDPGPPPTGPGVVAEGSIALITIPILDDGAVTGDRTFTLTLFTHVGYITNISTNMGVISTNLTSTPTNCYVGDYHSHTFTIVDIGTNIVDITATTPLAFEQNTVPGVFTIKRSGPTNNPLTVFFAVSGTASSGADYVPLGNSVTIPAGTNSVTLKVVPNDDTTEEIPETVIVTLMDEPGYTVGNGQASIIIVDNDGTIQFTAANYFANEGDGTALLGVQRTGNTNLALTVNYLVFDGSATNGVDYLATNGVVNFAPGSVLQTIPIQLLNNFVVQPTRAVNLVLTNATGGVPLGGQSAATLFILDDDTAFVFATNNFRVYENGTNALISVARLGLTNNPFNVTVWTTDGTATNGLDYTGVTNTLAFGPGETNKTFLIPIKDDALFEGDESFVLHLTNAIVGAPIGGSNSASVTIVDDECALQFSSPAYSVEEYAGSVTLVVQRVGGTVNPVSVNYRTIDGTAIGTGTNNIDYVGGSGTLFFRGDQFVLATNGSGALQFQPGDTNQTVSIPIIDNVVGTGNKTFTVLLSGPSGPLPPLAFLKSTVLGTPTNAVVTIIDNETPGNVDFEFNPGIGPNNRVLAVALQADLSVVFGGDFTTVNNIVYNRIARLQPNGNLDVSFNPGAGVNGTVDAIAVQADKRIMVAGLFTSVDSTNRANVARLNLDGNLDLSFDPGTGPNKLVRAIAVQADGKILIGGDFTQVGSSGRFHLARLNANGTLDNTFSVVVSDSVYALAVQPDGKILLGGNFTTIGATARAYVGRLNTNGTVDTTFNPGTGANNTVTALAIQDDGRIVIGGKFITFNGTNWSYLARLTSTGGLDPAFNPGTGPNASVNAVGVHSAGKIVIGGDFSSFNGLSRSRFARLNSDGSLDAIFGVGTGANATVRAVSVQPDSAILLGGEFTLLEDLPRSYIGRIHGEEKLDLTGVSFSQPEYAISEGGGAAVITVVRSGNTNRPFSITFGTTNGSTTPFLDYTPTNGTLSFVGGEISKTFSVPVIDDTLIEGNETIYLYLTNPPANVVFGAYPNAVLTILDNENNVRFSLTNYSVLENATNGIISLSRLGAITGAVSVTFSTSDGTAIAGIHYVGVTNVVDFADGQSNQTVLVPILDDGVPGAPLVVNLHLSNPVGVQLGLADAFLTIIDTDPGPGGVDPNFDPGAGANGFVRSLALQPDGRILVGGGFTIFDNVSRNYVTRLNTNGTHDLTFDPGMGADSFVAAVASLADGTAVLGGSFTNVGGALFNHVARLLTNGAPDVTFVQGAGFNASANALAVQDSGRITVGGAFTLPSHGLIQLLPAGSIDYSFNPGTGADGPVHCVLAGTNGGVVLGGAFTSVNGFPRARVAKMNPDGLVDPGFVTTAITNGSVYSAALQSDGKVVVGGDFFTTGKTNRVGLARLNANGSLDTSFDPGTGADAAVFAVAVQATGKIIIGGSFTAINQTNRNRFARLNQNGSLDLTFDPGTGANSTVYAVLLLPGGNFLIGGDFNAVNGVPRNRVARIKADDVDPRFLSIVLPPGNPAELTLLTQGGRVYVLEVSANLTTWTPVRTNTAAGPTLILEDPIPNAGTNRFYRARQF